MQNAAVCRRDTSLTYLWYLVGEIWKGFVRSPITTCGLVVSLTLLLLLLELFWVVAIGSDSTYRELLSSVEIELFVSDSLADSSVVRIEDSLQAIPQIVSRVYVSREQARSQLTQIAGRDLLADYDSLNPLPRSFLVTCDPEVYLSGQFPSLLKRIEQFNQGGEIVYSKQWLSDAQETRLEIRRVGIGLGLICLAAAVFNLISGIRLLARTRAAGTAQLLLLGASRLFVAMPFMVEGAIAASVAALLSWLAVWYSIDRVHIPGLDPIIPPITEIALFCLAVALLGAMSGYIGVRRTLSYSR